MSRRHADYHETHATFSQCCSSTNPRRPTHLTPAPITAPAVTNSPVMLLVVKEAESSPIPMREIPSSAVFRAPSHRINLAFAIARTAIKTAVTGPTKESVEVDATFSATKAACSIPCTLLTIDSAPAGNGGLQRRAENRQRLNKDKRSQIQAYVVPTNQKVITEQAETTTQP